MQELLNNYNITCSTEVLKNIQDLQVSDFLDASFDDIKELGLSDELCNNIISILEIENKPFKEWCYQSVLFKFQSFGYLSAHKSTITTVITNNQIDGDLLSDNTITVSELKELIPIPTILVKRLMSSIKELLTINLDKQNTNEENTNSNSLPVPDIISDLSLETDSSQEDMKNGIIEVPFLSQRPVGVPWKTILLVGETGTGKSTTINSFVNFLYGVKYEDKYRYKLIFDETKDQSQSVTCAVGIYHIPPHIKGIDFGITIIDTPGFGDTRGLKQDEIIVKQIEEAFNNEIDEVDAVCFTIRAGCSRLTHAQKYVYGKILGLFGNNIKENIFMLITFCDGTKPPAISAINSDNIPYKNIIKLNNSAFFNGFEDSNNQNNSNDNDEEDMSKIFWDMGRRAFQNFIKQLRTVSTTSLSLSKTVLSERKTLELCVCNINKDIRAGLHTMECIRSTVDLVKQHAVNLNSNSNYKISVEVPCIEKICIKGKGIHTTTCLVCNYTCHNSCIFANDDDKAKCKAMKNGICTQCPGKCAWNLHHNVPYLFKVSKKKEMQTLLSKKEAHDAAKRGISNTEVVLNKQKDKFLQTKQNTYENILKVRSVINCLEKIALRPNVLQEDDHFECMIQAEENDCKPGWEKRVQIIRDIQKDAKTLSEIAGGNNPQLFVNMSKELAEIEAQIKLALTPNSKKQKRKQSRWGFIF